MTIDFTQRIKANRKHRSRDTEDGKIASLSEFESDRGRIINSAAIRRLQQKTQVFPLERNAAVRSRLTHSMEVQQVGRFITQLVFKELSEDDQRKYGLFGLERQFESIVEMSCLMHDVGNPPFGHFGEDTMIKWFQKHIDRLFSPFSVSNTEEALTAIKQDICNFEGNAQAIRLVHTILGLNLTYSQISGIMKYTRRGDLAKPQDTAPQSYLQKKVGFYLSEVPIIGEIQQNLKISEGCRSPFAYVMEAADDISYGVADIEDAIEKDILSVDQLPKLLMAEYHKICSSEKFDITSTKVIDDILGSAKGMREKDGIDSMFFVGLRVGINRYLPKYASQRFVDNIEEIFIGQFNQALIEDYSECHAVVETLKTVARKYAFCAPEVEMQELQGFKIIQGLLNAYAPLLTLSRAEFQSVLKDDYKNASGYTLRMFHKLPKKHLRAYRQAVEFLENEDLKESFISHFTGSDVYHLADDAWEFYFRCRLIQDYISGMTDQFAYDEFRELNVV